MNEKEILKKLKKEEKANKIKINLKWFFIVTLLSLIISIAFSLISELIMPNVNILIGIVVMLFFIILGIFFDILGVSATTADIRPYHSMAAKKLKGAKRAVILAKNADKVSSIFCDVVGDICGIISGSAGVYIAAKLSVLLNINVLYPSLVITGIISAITIGGKALGKSYAINNGTTILYGFAKFLTFFKKAK